MRLKLAQILNDGINPTLRTLNQDKVHIAIADMVVKSYGDSQFFMSDLHNIELLVLNYDYRLVAVYLWALRSNQKQVLRIFKEIFVNNDSKRKGQLLYKLAYQRFRNERRDDQTLKILLAKTFDEIFTFEDKGVLIYFLDNRYKEQMIVLLENLAGNVSDFFKQQYDLPGRNAVVRQGAVKTWNLPNGTEVVSKCQNIYKLDKFRREQLNYYAILNNESQSNFILDDPGEYGKKIYVQIAHPFALINDGYTGTRYALFKKMPGVTLEEILYEEKDKSVRSKYLTHYRLILDKLYNLGILWGDMSPRNILVHKQEDRTNYALVDFEKTTIFDGPISHHKRLEHWRGQLFIEELCVICPIEEVVTHFGKYFNPSRWDTKSLEPLSFELRPDVINLLEARDITDIRLCDYNDLDLKILEIRRPHCDTKAKKYHYPGEIGFKVEHYLSCIGDKEATDYDRKNTEVLLAAQEHKCFVEIANLLLEKASALERKLVELEFLTLLEGGFSGNLPYPSKESGDLKTLLDNLYAQRQSSYFYSKLIRNILTSELKGDNTYA